MSKSILVTLTNAGPGTGPFDIYYTNISGQTLVANNVPKASLLAGYTVVVPDDAESIIVQSDNTFCSNGEEFVIPTTTTTSTTTTTTTTIPPINLIEVYNCFSADLTVYSTCSVLEIGCILYEDLGLTTPISDGVYCNDIGLTNCFTVSGGFGEITNVGSCVS